MKKFKLINELTESKLIRTIHNYKKYNSQDITEFLFLYILTLQILRNDVDYKKFTKDYAYAALRYSNFDKFRMASNDLYLFLHVLFGKNHEKILSSLKSPEGSLDFLTELNVDYRAIKNYLFKLYQNRRLESEERRFLYRIEKELKISNPIYKNLRRLIMNWDRADHRDRELVVTRLLFAFRAKMIRSELYPVLTSYSKEKKLEYNRGKEKAKANKASKK